jgi:hypothetical protein
MLNAFSRDIRSVRAQENIGVHLGAPLLVEHFPENVILTYSLIVAVRLRPELMDQRASGGGIFGSADRCRRCLFIGEDPK